MQIFTMSSAYVQEVRQTIEKMRRLRASLVWRMKDDCSILDVEMAHHIATIQQYFADYTEQDEYNLAIRAIDCKSHKDVISREIITALSRDVAAVKCTDYVRIGIVTAAALMALILAPFIMYDALNFTLITF